MTPGYLDHVPDADEFELDGIERSLVAYPSDTPRTSEPDASGDLPMTRLSYFDTGIDRFRVGTWHGDETMAYIAPASSSPKPTRDGVARCLDHLRAAGYRGAVTSALRSFEAAPFLQLGFEEREHLEVLRHDLVVLPEVASRGIRLRRGRRGDRSDVLALDAAAFEPFWRLDSVGLDEALGATPSVRFRVIDAPNPAAYTICGRASRVGYVQRLAVEPLSTRRGFGRILVADSLRWLKNRGAHTALVNTQITNEAAIALYTALGFEFENENLAVLGCSW